MSIDRETPAPGERWTNEKWLEVEVKELAASYRKKLEALASYRAWWEEVKSGQRTFSFKGQVVEYRFRPDGTWDTIPIANPPVDGPDENPPAATDSGKRDAPPTTVGFVKSDDHTLWWWVAGAVGMLVALAIALFRKSRRAG
jgi:hypothetical protein